MSSKGIKLWLIFFLLGIIWGTSFLWIKIGVDEIGPLSLVAFRLLFGFLGLLTIATFKRETFGLGGKIAWAFAFMGAFNVVIPFLFISWGEKIVPSGLASVLNSTMPLFTIIFAHFWLHDEKISLFRIGGLFIGFLGILVLLSEELFQKISLLNLLQSNQMISAQLAVITAAICYAIATTFSRRYLRNQPPLSQSILMMFYANIFIWPLAFTMQKPFLFPHSLLTWISVIWLGLLGSCLAYILYFRLLNEWGATRSSLTTYVIPMISIFLGVIFLHESLDWRDLIGSFLILSGVFLVNLKTNGKP